MDYANVYETQNEELLNKLYNTNSVEILECCMCGKIDFNSDCEFENANWLHPHQSCDKLVCGTACAATWFEIEWEKIEEYNEKQGKL